MPRLLLSHRCLFLLCAPLVLAGCQHPLAPAFAGHQPARINRNAVDATPVMFSDEAWQFSALAMTAEPCVFNIDGVDSNPPKEASPVVAVQKEQDCLTGQLADSLMNVFKTFTGR
jgi:hypothetical protein